MTANSEELRKEVERSIEQLEKAPVRQETRNAKVEMNIHPNAIPLKSINPKKLIEGMEKLFGSRFDSSDLMKFIPPTVPRESLSPSALIEMALANEKGIQFVGGVVKYPDLGRITPIERVGFGSQSLAAVVVGTTDEAVYIAKQLCLELWKSAGLERTWADLSGYVERQKFQTQTAVDLGFPLSKLLDPRLSTFLQHELTLPSGLGRQMGIQELDPTRQKQKANDVLVIPHCHRVELKISIIDKVSGDAEDTALTFLIASRTEANRTKALVSSELSSERHAELVQRVVSVLAT